MEMCHSSVRKAGNTRNMGEETHYSNNSLEGKFLPAQLPRRSVVRERDRDQEGQVIVRVFIMGTWRGEKELLRWDRKSPQRFVFSVHSCQLLFLPPNPP